MINLSLPAISNVVYGVIFDMPIGPISTNGKPTEEFIPTQIDQDHLDQGRISLYGEKDVYHVKTQGTVKYHAYYRDITRSPTASRPNWCTWLTKLYPGGGNTASSLPAGLIGFDSTDMELQPSTTGHYTWSYASNGFMRHYVQCVKDSPTIVRVVSRVEVRHIYFDANRIQYEYRVVSKTLPVGGLKTSNDWTLARSASEILAVVNSLQDGNTGSWSAASTTAMMPRTMSSVSPAAAALEIDALVGLELNLLDFPDGEADYGDLAMTATEKANANQVNMIAFLRDIRKPKELIPKLKNFWKLKTLSGNYLNFEYGILPTIDDIKSIIGACKKIKPYLDKNGFATYTASKTSTDSKHEVYYETLQRIKVAIANEDYGFLSIINKVDNAGFLPTFENVWDLVPYSFVLDWFIDIGSLLERIDADLRIIRLPVRYATMSRKTTARYTITPSLEFPFSGTVEKVRYHRWTTDHCPVPTPSVSPTTDFTHWVEAIALLIQRKK